MIDPNDFVIARKRKKYKFAKFANAKNCFEYNEFLLQGPTLLQGWTLQIEMGAGTGLFSVELAAQHPEAVFVAIDVKGDRLQKGAYEALERGIENVLFVRARADQIDQLFAPKSVEKIWLTFPDPFPRKHSAGRRMTHPNFLKKYATLLAPKGSFCLKHDNPAFFSWSLEQLVGQRWHIKELSFDLHDSELSDDYKIKTTYEQRWLEEGRTTHFVRAVIGE
jgi:tRNA (guanine-N7-)-methyltransferase